MFERGGEDANEYGKYLFVGLTLFVGPCAGAGAGAGVSCGRAQDL